MSSFISFSVTALFILNIFLAIALIFLERRDASSTWAWLMVLFFVPFFGFVIYLLLGRKLREKHLFRWEGRDQIGIDKLIEHQIHSIEDNTLDFRHKETEHYKDMIYLHLRNNDAVLTQDNDVEIFNDGNAKFDALIQDLESAKDHIHFQYYIMRLDNLGKRILEVLIRKAKQGVQVRVLYDDMGSRNTQKRHFKELIEHGGQVEAFFPAVLPLINPRLITEITEKS